MPAPVKHPHHRGSPCRASACGATVWYYRASRAGATKRLSFVNSFFGISFKILIQKGLKIKKITDFSLPTNLRAWELFF
jgi:hypothetical protein